MKSALSPEQNSYLNLLVGNLEKTSEEQAGRYNLSYNVKTNQETGNRQTDKQSTVSYPSCACVSSVNK